MYGDLCQCSNGAGNVLSFPFSFLDLHCLNAQFGAD